MTKRYVFFDTEGHNAGHEWRIEPDKFVKLCQYAINDGPVILTEDIEEFRQVLRDADYIVGHNILSADLGWVFGQDSLEPLHMAFSHKVIDTYYLANLLTPAPYSYTNSKGHTYYDAAKPESAMGWLSLANLSYQFGLPGKIGDLAEIAKRYNPPKTLKKDLDYGLIDVEDEEYRSYAIQDVIAVRALYHHLVSEIKRQKYSGEYIWREMKAMAATCGRMAANGILVNQEYAHGKIDEAAVKKQETLAWLQERYDFPTEGKAPWSTAAGKDAIYNALAEYGISPKADPEWPKTPTGAPQLSGENLVRFTEGTEAEELGQALAALKGQRTIPQQILDNMKEDGRVHPNITALQRSGRWSVTKPGITVMGDRSEALKADKQLLIAAPGKVLAGFDFSNADPRAMAALSGDVEFARRFEEDENGAARYDGHNLTGEALFGQEVYYSILDKKGKPAMRPASKEAGNSLNYNIGAYKLATRLNDISRKQGLGLVFWAPAGKGRPALPHPEGAIEVPDMIHAFNDSYPDLKRFKDRAVEEGKRFGYVTSTWGRRMPVDKDREYTQAPSLYGQNVTAEMMRSAVIRLCERGDYYARSLRAIIHDELLLELDEDRVEEDIKVVRECMEVAYDPGTLNSLAINFPVGYGYGKTWFDAAH